MASPISRYILLLSGLILSLALSAPQDVRAQEPSAEPSVLADRHYQQAMLMFNQGRYREAVKHFNDAIELAPDPIFYCNRAIALIKLDELDEAIKSMITCRDTIGEDPQEVAQIDAQLQALTIFAKQLRPHAQTLARDIAAGPVIKKVEPTPAPVDDGWSASDFGYISLALGGACFASAITLDLLSAQDVETLKKEQRGGDKARYDEARSSIEQRQPLWIGLSAAGTGLALLGVTLIIVDLASDDEPAQPAQPSITLSPAIGPRQVGAALSFEF